VLVAGELPREQHNAPLHLFSASPELIGFGSRSYRQRSADTSLLLRQLFKRFEAEGLTKSYTMADFRRDYVKERFSELPPEDQEEVLKSLPPEKRLAGLPPEERLAGLPPEERLAGLSARQMEQVRQYLDRLLAGRAPQARKSKRKT
jgi:hypothetical protein